MALHDCARCWQARRSTNFTAKLNGRRLRYSYTVPVIQCHAPRKRGGRAWHCIRARIFSEPSSTEAQSVARRSQILWRRSTIAAQSNLHQWVFLLLRAQEYDEAELRRLLGDNEFQPVITTLQTIATKKKDRQMYDRREKARRDQEWFIAGAKQDGIEIRLEKGNWIGTNRTLQELLGEPVVSTEELRAPKNCARCQSKRFKLKPRSSRNA